MNIDNNNETEPTEKPTICLIINGEKFVLPDDCVEELEPIDGEYNDFFTVVIAAYPVYQEALNHDIEPNEDGSIDVTICVDPSCGWTDYGNATARISAEAGPNGEVRRGVYFRGGRLDVYKSK